MAVRWSSGLLTYNYTVIIYTLQQRTDRQTRGAGTDTSNADDATNARRDTGWWHPNTIAETQDSFFSDAG